MQTVVTPHPARTQGPGHQVAPWPLPPSAPGCELHTLAVGATMQWPPGQPAPLLLLTEGMGKAQLDGAALRVTAPCALCLPPTVVLRLSNQGSTPMRLLALHTAPLNVSVPDTP